MKKNLIVLMLSFSTLGFAQQTPNRFAEESSANGADNSLNRNVVGNNEALGTQNDAGNPGDPVPIDDYVPLLVVIAFGLIFYTTQKKKKFLSENNNQ